jgi:hypothetical protein
MPDPLTITAAIALAGRAFKGVQKMVELGREAEDTFGQIGKWFEACHDVNKAKERAQNPPLFKKIAASSSVEKAALEALIAQKKMLEQRKQLRSLIVLSYGKDAWEELHAMEKKIRAERTRLIHDRIKARQKIIDVFCIMSGVFFIVIIVVGFLWAISKGG